MELIATRNTIQLHLIHEVKQDDNKSKDLWRSASRYDVSRSTHVPDASQPLHHAVETLLEQTQHVAFAAGQQSSRLSFDAAEAHPWLFTRQAATAITKTINQPLGSSPFRALLPVLLHVTARQVMYALVLLMFTSTQAAPTCVGKQALLHADAGTNMQCKLALQMLTNS